MAYDPVRNVTVLYGGRSGMTVLDDGTWLYDGRTASWTHLVDAFGPASDFSAMAYDAVHQELVLFGGYQSGAETWTWNGATWRRRMPTTSPPARALHSMAWDPDRQRVVMFGGRQVTSGLRHQDLWEWDGTNWQQRVTTGGPIGLSSAMAWDPTRHVLVVFGAHDQVVNNELWELGSGSAWLLRSPSNPPSPRAGSVGAFFPPAAKVMVVGGRDGASNYLAGAFLTDGASWATVTPDCGARQYAAMTWDSARGKLVLFGGVGPAGELGDTWEY
ncbi:MAG: hypothetical protein ACOZQL_04285 [Myxococcota bacterium]